jgi:hypothetical protein
LTIVTRSNGIGNQNYLFPPLDKTKRCRKDSTLGGSANEDEFAGTNFTEEPFNAGLLKRVGAAFVKNDLPVIAKNVTGQVIVTIGGIIYSILKKAVTDFFLAFGAVNAIVKAIVVWINFTEANYGDFFLPCPSHYPADMRENPFMIANANFAASEKEVLLSVNVDDDLFSPNFYKLPEHI